MQLVMQADKQAAEVQRDFSSQFPFLKIEFFRKDAAANTFRKQPYHLPLSDIAPGHFKPGEMEVNDKMTVKEVEDILFTRFGLLAQVFRKSGKLWLETTMTDNWTLKQQNDHAEEIAIAFRPKTDDTDMDYDLDRDADR